MVLSLTQQTSAKQYLWNADCGSKATLGAAFKVMNIADTDPAHRLPAVMAWASAVPERPVADCVELTSPRTWMNWINECRSL